MTTDEIRKTIIDWSIRFPYDRLWRRKYNIPYNSQVHKEISFIDQMIDLEEDKFFDDLYASADYIPNTGDWIKIAETTLDNLEDSIKSFRDEFKDLDTEEDE